MTRLSFWLYQLLVIANILLVSWQKRYVDSLDVDEGADQSQCYRYHNPISVLLSSKSTVSSLRQRLVVYLQDFVSI